jgi:hypothetical protein
MRLGFKVSSINVNIAELTGFHSGRANLSEVARYSVVTRGGTVSSWTERHEAERVAWSVPDVTKVEDRIVVAHP